METFPAACCTHWHCRMRVAASDKRYFIPPAAALSFCCCEGNRVLSRNFEIDLYNQAAVSFTFSVSLPKDSSWCSNWQELGHKAQDIWAHTAIEAAGWAVQRRVIINMLSAPSSSSSSSSVTFSSELNRVEPWLGLSTACWLAGSEGKHEGRCYPFSMSGIRPALWAVAAARYEGLCKCY